MVESGPDPRARWRAELGALCCLAAAGAFGTQLVNAPIILFPIGVLLVTAGLARTRGLGRQVFVRAVLWSNLMLGLVLSVGAGRADAQLGHLLAVTTGAGLLVLGRVGLAEPSPAFRPHAFRGPLLLALVMALADALSLLLFAAVTITKTGGVGFLPLAACAAVMVLAIIGLYRLKTWAVGLNIVANIVVASLALGGCLELFEPVVYALCTTAVIQLLLPVPMLIAMVRGKAPARAEPHAAWAVVFPLLIVGIAGVSIAAPLWR